ncbi:uncharacterized protein LOC124290921 isoform X2 [Haliotis rubra]|uniref:uncharacterized protein LOC124290921 isoform X2 n=1 Tax=Haliotis rubra TaxID=36100 RepID=UPI001EE4EDEB|nr:uncharacterized protein LOC124290921 isoform X2 [Haliotis rubra]
MGMFSILMGSYSGRTLFVRKTLVHTANGRKHVYIGMLFNNTTHGGIILTPNEEDEAKIKFIFYDFECRQDEQLMREEGFSPQGPCPTCPVDNCPHQSSTCQHCHQSWCGKCQHVPNYLVAQSVCPVCRSMRNPNVITVVLDALHVMQGTRKPNNLRNLLVKKVEATEGMSTPVELMGVFQTHIEWRMGEAKKQMKSPY